MRRLFTNSSAKATWSADNGFFTCLVSMAECCICKEADGQVACPKSCRQAGLMHLTCILNYTDTAAVPKCPACRRQRPAWVLPQPHAALTDRNHACGVLHAAPGRSLRRLPGRDSCLPRGCWPRFQSQRALPDVACSAWSPASRPCAATSRW